MSPRLLFDRINSAKLPRKNHSQRCNLIQNLDTLKQHVGKQKPSPPNAPVSKYVPLKN